MLIILRIKQGLLREHSPLHRRLASRVQFPRTQVRVEVKNRLYKVAL